uniref:Uncharacterized protein n=1 Tax=Ditylenchus dipsaci TaxID=166011 RepID=A0A915DVH5_9BILA
MVTFGMALALQWSIFITADKMLTKLEYVDQVSNYLLALSALSGSVASILAGYFVDRSKMFKEIIKSCYIGAALVAIASIFFCATQSNPAWTLLHCLELGVETTFPVAEATSSGILIIAGQLLLFLTTFVMQCLESVDWFYGKKTENYQLSIDFWTIAAVFSAIFSCAFLWPRYHRLEYEENVTFFNSSPALETPNN